MILFLKFVDILRSNPAMHSISRVTNFTAKRFCTSHTLGLSLITLLTTHAIKVRLQWYLLVRSCTGMPLCRCENCRHDRRSQPCWLGLQCRTIDLLRLLFVLRDPQQHCPEDPATKHLDFHHHGCVGGGYDAHGHRAIVFWPSCG